MGKSPVSFWAQTAQVQTMLVLLFSARIKNRRLYSLQTMKIFLLSVILAWNPNVETNISHYLLYAGPSSRSYTNCTNVGKVTNATYRTTGTNAWYFTVTAVNTLGLESLYSNEVLYNPTGGTNQPPSSNFVYRLTNIIERSLNFTNWIPVATNVYEVPHSNYWRARLEANHMLYAPKPHPTNAPSKVRLLPMPPMPK